VKLLTYPLPDRSHALDRAMPQKLDPETDALVRSFAELLEEGKSLQGLMDLEAW
jgi:hypothetical protein